MPTPPPTPPAPPSALSITVLPPKTYARVFTDPYQEIQSLIFRYELNDADIKYYCHLKPIRQQGPQCGLVALAMAAQEYPRKIAAAELYEDARQSGFTQHGEIYSVDSMAKLAAKYMADHRPEILRNLEDYPYTITRALTSGAKVLIPYDSDLNNAPTLKRGHKAHWALLVGLISSEQGYHVLARHGKTARLALWPLADLLESNANLEEEGPIRHTGGYVIPDGGVGGKQGLKGRAVALHPCNSPVTSL
ncbi:UPF0692 protein CG33108 [Copidosoma floridanum]|uniref:UPF0692 protein CG33108 n=1 Tax=Copidosoma floridanum TaxID=29053 RepID=UPI0006C981C3|nr:UPF0692 protein CG33108 [Copidosoma floridanum]